MPSNEELSQGAKANYAGKAYENMLRPLFTTYGYEISNWAPWRDRHVPLEESGKIAIHQFPYKTMYGGDGHTEWLLVNNAKNIILRLEVKTQRSSGSVDEKFPYTYINSLIGYPEKDVILLVDGVGFRDGAVPWLKNAVETRWLQDMYGEKNIKVLSYTEFVDYFIKHLS